MPLKDKSKSPSEPPSLAHFQTLTTPTEQVQYSIPFFLSHYFLDASTGEPDPSKTPLAVTLPDLKPQLVTKLEEAVRGVPGLLTEVKRQGLNEYRALYVGWSQDAMLEAAKAHWQAVDERKAAEEAARQAGRSAKHREYLQKLVTGAGAGRTEFDIRGAYTVRCPSIDDQWDGTDEMELHVREAQGGVEGVYEAQFKFRVLEGVMLLCANRETLVRHRSALDKVRGKDADWDWDYMKDSAQLLEQQASLAENSSNKRKLGDSDGGAGGSQPKKRKGPKHTVPEPHPRRFWLMWNGRETGEGEMQYDYENNHTGCLEFADDKFTAFKGEMNLEFVGGDDMLFGEKVSDKPSNKGTSSWTKFT
ncbi:uncharacterized protein JN550_011399 [Neoarthrinium moseri]|uniref:uncharacterized protein n=1 Tax=Neoarthrinium moseri TaxID=1658444 RepID=UPI001FDE51A5|nr:uncharacterized protein JN550_011399 [Neoarthrinium moseri]KAI1860674.1 hypothetical protein JN550_011399 [Neoarthrinium moseri]